MSRRLAVALSRATREAFKEVMKFVAAMRQWGAAPEVAKALVKRERYRKKMFDARRAA
jgi:hypothetical protein